MRHCLQLQVEDPLLTRLSRGASYRGTVVIGQKKAISFSSCTPQCSDILIPWVRQVSHNLTSLFHQGTHGNLKSIIIMKVCTSQKEEGTLLTTLLSHYHKGNVPALKRFYRPSLVLRTA